MIRGKRVVKRSLQVLSLVAFGWACFSFHTLPANASTGINQEISFEGKMVKSDGTNITDGTYNMEFKVYAGGNNNGGGTLDWTEDWLVHNSQGVTLTNGTFQVDLGSITAFSNSVNWNSYPLFLSIQIGNTSNCTISSSFQSNCGGDGEMTPYIQFDAVPYAFNANQLGGLASSSYAQLAANQTFTGQNTFSRNGSGTTDASVLFTGTPVNNATSSLIRIGNAIAGGNNATNGGTYLGLNEPSSGAGSAADFLNFQNNNTVELQLTSAGVLTAGGNITTTATVQGGTVNATSAIQLNGANINTGGTLTNVAYLNQANTFTLANSFSTSVLTPLLDTASGVTLNIGTTNATSISLKQNTSLAANKNFTFTAGSGNFDQSASSGTFATGTGTVSLNGNTTIAGSNTFATGTGTVSLNGATTVASNISFTADGSVVLQDATNAETAFQVENSVGGPILLGDTTTTMPNGNTLDYLAYPGFESGSFSNANAGWAAVAPATLSQNTNEQNSYNGLDSAKVITTSSNGGLTTSSFAATPGSGTYLVSFYAMVSSGSIASTAFTVQTTDSGTHSCSPSAGITINSSGFQRLYCSIAPTANVTALQITQTDNTARTIYLDAIQMQSNSYDGTTITTPTAYQFGAVQLRGVVTNPVSLANDSDSTTAFQIQNAEGSQLLAVNTFSSAISLLANTTVGNSSTFTVSRNGSGTTDASVLFTGTPVNNATSSLIRIGNAIAGGNNATNGGTYLGLNEPSSGAGSAADFLNFQNNNTVELQLTSAGVLTAGGNITTTATVQGGTVNATSAIQLNGANINTGGTLTNVAYLNQNQTFTGTDTFQPTTNINSVTIMQTSAGSPTADIFDVQTANATNVIQVTGPAANQAAVSITSQGSSSGITLTSATANITFLAPTVLVGSAGTGNTTQYLLQPNSVTTFTEAASCTTSTNQGALYYNTTTNAIRSCINGAWDDLASTAGLGIILFGVEVDSGTNPGDLEAQSTAGASGPCKVSYATTTTITVQACTLYSGGRKIVQSQVTITMPSMTSSQFTHLCYWDGSNATGPLTNNTKWFTTPSTTETANLPTFSASAPVLCLATIIDKAGSANTIGNVYDTRVFAGSQKQFTYGAVALAPGWITIYSTSNTTQVTTVAVAATKGIAGTVAVGNAAAYSSGGPNAILVTGGPAEVETLAGGTGAINVIETSATAGYATTASGAGISATLSLPNLYMGVALTAFSNCVVTPGPSSCLGSILTQILWQD